MGREADSGLKKENFGEEAVKYRLLYNRGLVFSSFLIWRFYFHLSSLSRLVSKMLLVIVSNPQLFLVNLQPELNDYDRLNSAMTT
jgi:hypothetical protein